MSDLLVHLDRVTCAYDRRPVLANVTLKIAAGDFTGIVGPSGSGKTTVLRAIIGTLRPVLGEVWRRPRLTLGYVPQVDTINWNFPVTVTEVLLMSRIRGRTLPWASGEEKRQVRQVAEGLGIGDLVRRHIRELSGGQQQRVFIARALMARPDLLLLDEPTSGVDVPTRHHFLHLLAELNAGGVTILLTTHDLNGMAAHLPSLVCLNTEVIAQGPPKKVLTPAVLQRTYDAPMEVLEHAGMPVVIDRYEHPGKVIAWLKQESAR